MTALLILYAGIALFAVTMAFLQWFYDRRGASETRTRDRKHA